jgi:transposase
MVRVGEDISERLDIVPAQFFVQRQIRGKWACRCCQLMVQESAAPQVFDNALPTPALQAHTVISRFVDHLPYYRQEQINARSGVYTPRSTLAAWGGQTGAQLLPLYNAHRAFVLGSRVLHADDRAAHAAREGRSRAPPSPAQAYPHDDARADVQGRAHGQARPPAGCWAWGRTMGRLRCSSGTGKSWITQAPPEGGPRR